MAFPTVGVLDTFNRADGDAGANYTANAFNLDGSSGSWTIVSNAVKPPSFDYCEPYWDVETFGPDAEAYITWASGTIASSGDFGVGARIVSPATAGVDGYRIAALPNTSEVKIQIVTNGVISPIGATITQATAAGDSIGIACIGSTIEAWFKASGGSWVLIGSRTNATYSAAGYIAAFLFHDSGGTAKMDDFGGGTVVAGAPGAIIVNMQIG